MLSEDKHLLVGERVDALVNVDVPSRNVIHLLYPPAREKAGRPLCLSAAELLVKSLAKGQVVLICTGWLDRPHISLGIAETDGPPGAAALARAVHRGLGAVPLVLVEDTIVEPMSRVLNAAGLRVLAPDEAIKAAGSGAPIHAASVMGFPSESAAAAEEARRILDWYSPGAVITVEKGGMNDRGVIHTSRGADTSAHTAKIDLLVLEAARRRIPSIGIGDGGNEIGMGNIKDVIREKLPYGASCVCGCGGGIAPETVTDVLVTACISNWGAYGVAACLAMLCGDLEVFHDAADEERVLLEASRASLIDGITGYTEPGADGLPALVHQSLVTLLRELIRQAVFVR